MAETNFSFLNKIPDQVGYQVLEDGVLIKSEGELQSRENIAIAVDKLAEAERFNMLPNHNFNQMTIHFGTHFFTICQSGKYTYVVKRRGSHKPTDIQTNNLSPSPSL